MAVEPIRQLKPMCKAHLKEFADCVSHKETRAHMDVYDREQLLDLDDTSPLKVVLAGQAPLPQTLRQPYPAAPQVFHQRDQGDRHLEVAAVILREGEKGPIRVLELLVQFQRRLGRHRPELPPATRPRRSRTPLVWRAVPLDE